MSRFVETTHKQKEVKKPQAPLPKAGSYTLKELEKAKPIYSGTGGKRSWIPLRAIKKLLVMSN